MVGAIMYLISGTHHSCEKRKYAFMVFREYTIIFLKKGEKKLEKEKITFLGYCMVGVISSKGKNWDDIIF